MIRRVNIYLVDLPAELRIIPHQANKLRVDDLQIIKTPSQTSATMHFTNLAIISLISWAAVGLAAPTPIPQFLDPSDLSDKPTPQLADKPFITTSADSGVNAHASLLG